MRFRSDRGGSATVDIRSAIVEGLASDGGLFVPDELPRLEAFAPASLIEAGVALLTPFFDDLSPSDLRHLLDDAWDFPAPIVSLEPGIVLLELFHGPTLAFKDFGARFLARYLSRVAPGDGEPLTILVATSGDTGGAVADGFAGVDGVEVVLLYPKGRVSPLQEAQMATHGGNIRAFAVEGSFDDCQRLVRTALGDPRIRKARRLTTANSINLGRLLPQLAYHAWAGATAPGADAPTFVVPSGNFGNLTAALYARAMGARIGCCVAAVNANDPVPRLLKEGTYRPTASRTTLSNAMDVGAPGNLSRIVALAGGEPRDVGRLIDALSIDDDTTLATIRSVHEASGRLIDPHTAVGVAAARCLPTAARPGDGVTVVAATAHPAKFPETIERSVGIRPEIPAPLRSAMERPILSRPLPADETAFRRILLDDGDTNR